MKKPFDLLAEFGNFGHARKISLRDPATFSAFVRHVGYEVQRALDDPILLYGQRTEAMFEALLVSLGGFELLKPEDSGRLFPAGVVLPGFRRHRPQLYRVAEAARRAGHALVERPHIVERVREVRLLWRITTRRR